MNFNTWRLALIALILSSASLRAQTDTSRELKQLTEQRDKDAATALDPINRRYQQSLEQLLRRATQANDLETALKIKEIVATQAPSSEPRIVGDWAIHAESGYNNVLTFRADGTGTRPNEGEFRWRLKGTTLYVSIDQPPTDKFERADKFQFPIKEGKLHGVNVGGIGLTLTRK